MVLKPKKSWKGYSFDEAIYRNKDTVKNILGLFIGLNLITGFDLKVFLLSVGGAILTLLAKMAQDSIDFYYTEVEI